MDIREPYSQFRKDLDKSVANYIKEKERRLEKLSILRAEVGMHAPHKIVKYFFHIVLINI